MAWLRGSTSMPTDSKSAPPSSRSFYAMLAVGFTADSKDKDVRIKIEYLHPSGGRSKKYRPES